jgi:predicted nuclease with TOPRIM domain
MGEGMMQTIITIVTVLGSAGAWQFYQSRMKLKHVEKKEDRSEQTMFRDDLRERVAVLEQKLEESYNEKQNVMKELTDVLQTLAEYKVRIEFLEKENDRLKNVR